MDRIYPASITVPFGTLEFAPLTQSVPLENAHLVSIELTIPPGHGGFTGIRIRSSQQQILPWGSVDWIIADNYTNVFPIDTEIGSRAISVRAYNTDVYDHTFYLRFHIRDLGVTSNDAPNNAAASLVGSVGSIDLEGFMEPGALPPIPLPPSLPPGMVAPSPPE